MGAKIVEAIGERQYLWICIFFAYFFYAAMNVTTMHIDLAYELALERQTETQNAVGGGVLRAYIDDILFIIELRIERTLYASVGFKRVEVILLVLLAVHPYGVHRLALVVVLSERVAHPIVAQIKTTHEGVSRKDYSEEIEYFALVHIGNEPYVAHRGTDSIIAIGGARSHSSILLGSAVLEHIYRSYSLVAPIHANHVAQKIHALLATQSLHAGAELV